MKKLLLIGPEECFLSFQTVEEDVRRSYDVTCVKLSPLTSLERQLLRHSPADHAFLVFCDDRFSSLVRRSLILSLEEKGYQALSYQSPTARLEGPVHIAASSIVMGGVTLAEGVQVGPYSVIGTGCYVGANARIAEAVTLQPFARLGSGVVVGPRVSIGSGVTLNDGVTVGHDGEIATPGVYSGGIEARTYLHPKLGGPARIYRFGV